MSRNSKDCHLKLSGQEQISANHSLVPVVQSSSSTSELSSPKSIHQHFYTVNISFNYSTPAQAPPQNAEEALPMISRLVGQQMKDLFKEEKKRRNSSSARRKSTRSSRRLSKEASFPPEVDALPIPIVSEDLPDDVTQQDTEESEMVEIPTRNKPKPKESEYQDITGITRKVRFRLVPSKRVKPVPEDQLPEKKFNKDKKRREYVELGKLHSLEPIQDQTEDEKRAKAKRRSRELARELY
ncbi:hypothetical protein L5515_011921 [Caenorhabditis briggsae]|uniref:Uncharacterized protein n=1 Tax=Caenorhabditis briggsae TaxID=6238 RepID=A0AAE9JG67_CAEBR|nr:hypothetical protein L5515_011921 [Caenorhabditis briggsae]